ncbi:MAG: nucleotidyltransferase domain-containing protein [Thermotogae bacterium]|nr:nucleotidyltransferase domain-containing protein [Thermotogota bacterium]
MKKAHRYTQEKRAKKIAIFGSRVRDDWKKDNDVDVLVKFDKKMDLLEFIGIKQEIEDEIGEKVDLITLNSRGR